MSNCKFGGQTEELWPLGVHWNRAWLTGVIKLIELFVAFMKGGNFHVID